MQKKSALELTASLRDCWTNIETKLEEELRLIKGDIQLQNSATKWQKIQEIIDNNAGDTSTEVKRRSNIETRQRYTRHSGIKKNYRFKRCPSHKQHKPEHILNKGEISLLSNGLNSYLHPRKNTQLKYYRNLSVFERKPRLKCNFCQENDTPFIDNEDTTYNN